MTSLAEGQQGTFVIYSPQKYFLTDSGTQCSTSCLCICETETCLTDKSYCKDLSKKIKEFQPIKIGVNSLIVDNQKDNYQIIESVTDIEEFESEMNSNCSGEVVPFIGEFEIRSSVIPAFELAQKYASEKGVELYVTSAYRTVQMQDAMFVSKGDLACKPIGLGLNCPHVSGCAVDVCLKRNGVFSNICYATTLSLSPTLKNEDTLLLKEIMEKAGFKGIYGEYWHFEYGLDKSAKTDSFTEIKTSYPAI